MLQILGFGKTIVISLWFVSALVFTAPLIYYFAIKNRKKFLLAAPLISLVIYSWFYQNNHSLAGINAGTKTFIVSDGFWRALAGICLGCVVYAVYDKYKDWVAGHLRVLRTLVEIGIMALISVMFYGRGNSVKDFTLTALMALLIFSVMSGGSYLSVLLNKLPINGKYTYAIYCNHWLINYIIKDYFPGHPFYPTLAIYLVIVILFSIFTTWLLGFISDKAKNIIGSVL